MKSPKQLLIWLILIAVGAAIAQIFQDSRNPPPASPAPTAGAITGRARIVDGDSLELAGTRIRLFGIDAPEGRQECRDASNRAYACGAEARRALEAAIAGRAVSCTPVGASHDRSVAICTVEGRDLSEGLVRGGHALELRQHSRGRYSEAEREARNARRGLWAGSFERPAQWRQEHPR